MTNNNNNPGQRLIAFKIKSVYICVCVLCIFMYI